MLDANATETLTNEPAEREVRDIIEDWARAVAAGDRKAILAHMPPTC